MYNAGQITYQSIAITIFRITEICDTVIRRYRGTASASIIVLSAESGGRIAADRQRRIILEGYVAC